MFYPRAGAGQSSGRDLWGKQEPSPAVLQRIDLCGAGMHCRSLILDKLLEYVLGNKGGYSFKTRVNNCRISSSLSQPRGCFAWLMQMGMQKSSLVPEKFRESSMSKICFVKPFWICGCEMSFSKLKLFALWSFS